MNSPTPWTQPVLRWLAERQPERNSSDLRADTPLVEEGWLNSLDALDLLLFLEEECGRPVDLAQLTPGAFASVDALCAFLSGPEQGEAA